MPSQALFLILTFAIAFAEKMQQALADGKFKLFEIFSFLPLLKDLPAVLTAIPSAKDEIQSLSEQNRDELIRHFANEFDLPNDDVEIKIEKAFAWVLHTYDFIASFRKKKE